MCGFLGTRVPLQNVHCSLENWESRLGGSPFPQGEEQTFSECALFLFLEREPPRSVCTNKSLTCQCLKKMKESVEPVSRDSDACGDATTGNSGSDFIEDCGSPDGAVRRQSCGGACDHADVPTPHEEDRQVEEGSSSWMSDPSASPSNFAQIWAEVARREVERERELLEELGVPDEKRSSTGARDKEPEIAVLGSRRRVVLVPALSCTSAQLGSLFDRQEATSCFRCSAVMIAYIVTVFLSAVPWCFDVTPFGPFIPRPKDEREREKERKREREQREQRED